MCVHQRAAIRAVIEQAGRGLSFLPVYSPDFNAIGQTCSKLGVRLRRLRALRAPTQVPEGAIAAAVDTITATDAQHCRHAGYPLAGQPA